MQQTRDIDEADLPSLRFFAPGERTHTPDYPYGFRERCERLDWVEQTERGQRVVSQTIYKGRANAEKRSTYATGRGFAQLPGGWVMQYSIKGDTVGFYDLTAQHELGKVSLTTARPYLPQAILKEHQDHETMQDAIGRAYERADAKHRALFERKTPEDIRAHIKDPKNWRTGSGGYHTPGGIGWTYNKRHVIVYLRCDFIEVCFYHTVAPGARLTPSLKAEAVEDAQRQLAAYLAAMDPQRIIIREREGEPPTVSVTDPQGHTTTMI
jgi:hypothetical protein